MCAGQATQPVCVTIPLLMFTPSYAPSLPPPIAMWTLTNASAIRVQTEGFVLILQPTAMYLFIPTGASAAPDMLMDTARIYIWLNITHCALFTKV